MNIFELAASKNTAKLNETLNPTIWTKHEHLKNAVKDQILVGAEEYCAYLGLTEAQVNDIVVSGDNASFKYTNESTIDVVVVADLDPDPTFREFFNEHKYKYNGQHKVKVDGHLVQFYVQPADEQFINNGSYSLLRESWVQIPKRTITEDTVSQLRALDLAARPRPQVKKKKKVVQEAITVTYGFGSDFLDEVGVTPDGVSASTCQFANEEDLNEVGITPDGTNASTCEFANEDSAPSSKEDIVQDFVQFCADQLGLERDPDLRIKRDPEWSKRAKTFGRYNPGTNQLEVSLANRHVMDILRTIAHELTHQHQHEREDVPSHAGETGSEWENEANARAGILMRDYGQTNPHLFDATDELDEDDTNEYNGIAASPELEELAQACDNWFSMLYTAQDIQTILSSPYSAQYKKPPTGVTKLYRCIFPRDKNAEAEKDTRLFISYATSLEGAENFRTLTAPNEQYYIIEKNIVPSDFILDFGSLYKAVMKTMPRNYENEGEVWLKRSPYYTKSTEDDIIVNHYWPDEELTESSGYIPTAAEAHDPRFEMALTDDVRPGALGKAANAFLLNTDSQGHPQELRTDGLVNRMMAEYLEFKK